MKTLRRLLTSSVYRATNVRNIELTAATAKATKSSTERTAEVSSWRRTSKSRLSFAVLKSLEKESDNKKADAPHGHKQDGPLGSGYWALRQHSALAPSWRIPQSCRISAWSSTSKKELTRIPTRIPDDHAPTRQSNNPSKIPRKKKKPEDQPQLHIGAHLRHSIRK